MPDCSPQTDPVPISDEDPPEAAAPVARADYPPAAYDLPETDVDELTGSPRLSLGEHLQELRTRLIICLLTVGGVFIFGLFFYRQLYDLARWPILWAARGLGQSPDALVKFQALGPLDAFLWIVRIDLFLALILTLPVLIYHLWAFVAPGLTGREKRAVLYIFSAGSGLFLTGVAVAFRVAAPIGLAFLLTFTAELPGFENRWTGPEYMSFLVLCCTGFGLCFETPLVILALVRCGLLTPEQLLARWRHVVLAAFVIGAIFTPPDPLTQIVLASLLIALFFAGYFLAKWTQPPAKVGG